MKFIDRNTNDSNTFSRIRKIAEHGLFDGKSHNDNYLTSCRWFLEKFDCSVIFTRDTGHHACGWWKNPDYERCYHLSICFRGGRSKSKLRKIISGLFGNSKKFIWEESPFSNEGKANEIWHYRVFCDQGWNPILPRKEVYTKEFTELNWKSSSELKWLNSR